MELPNFPRYQVRFSGVCSPDDVVSSEGALLDLSVRGCRIASPARLIKGTELQLRLNLEDHDQGAPVEIDRAVVQWTDGDAEFGVEFLDVPEDAPERIRRFVRALEVAPSH